MEDQSPKYRRRGRVAALITGVVVVVLMFINFANSKADEGGGQSILIQFGDPDAGMNDAYDPYSDAPDDVQESQEAPDAQVSDADVTDDVLTDDNSDAPAIKKKEDPKKETSDNKKEVEKPADKPKTPKFSGSTFNPNKSGGGRSDGNKPGQGGDPDGSGDNPTGGLEPGAEGDIGGNLRKLGSPTFRPTITDDPRAEGKIVVNVIVNSKGVVTSARATQRGSENYVTELIRIAEREAKKFRFRASNEPETRGTITFEFKYKGK